MHAHVHMYIVELLESNGNCNLSVADKFVCNLAIAIGSLGLHVRIKNAII